MKFYQLALKYLLRKKSKTFLLFFVLLLVNTMILSICMILRATDKSMQSMQAKMSSKIIAEVSDANTGITDAEAEQIRNLPDVGFVNRIGRYEAFPSDFSPVTANASSEEDNRKVALLSYDDLEKDSPFSELQYQKIQEAPLFMNHWRLRMGCRSETNWSFPEKTAIRCLLRLQDCSGPQGELRISSPPRRQLSTGLKTRFLSITKPVRNC